MISFEFVVFIGLIAIVEKENSNGIRLFDNKQKHDRNKYFFWKFADIGKKTVYLRRSSVINLPIGFAVGDYIHQLWNFRFLTFYQQYDRILTDKNAYLRKKISENLFISKELYIFASDKNAYLRKIITSYDHKKIFLSKETSC